MSIYMNANMPMPSSISSKSQVVLDTRESLKYLYEECASMRTAEYDVLEIMDSVVAAMGYYPDIGLALDSYIDQMRVLYGTSDIVYMERGIRALAADIYNQLAFYNMWGPDGYLNYISHRLIGYDLVIIAVEGT